MTTTQPDLGTATGAVSIPSDDPRFPSLVRGLNHRIAVELDCVRVPASTQEVVDAVNDAMAAGVRVTVRSGGHGFEGAASDDGGVLLDLSEMTDVDFDPVFGAFAVQPGATLGHLYRVLFKRWGVTLPAGECPEVGIGGHVVGGGFGPLSRSRGSVVDYLYAVEVVVVDADGTARAVVATRAADDPNRELWWAHTGGGGGNFGVVTRYWFRAPGAVSDEPGEVLPPAPNQWRSGNRIWMWSDLDEEDFVTVVRNTSAWFEANSDPGDPNTRLMAFFYASHRSGGFVSVGAMVDGDAPDGEERVNAYLDACAVGVKAASVSFQKVQPWLYMATYPGFGDLGNPDTRRVKIKAAYLRKGYTEEQVRTVHRHLSTDEKSPTYFILIGYGGQVNAVGPTETAIAQRDSILKAAYMGFWSDPADDETHLRKLRDLYADVYRDTGGVPVPNERNDGSYINYPDVDLADPELNRSGVPWHELYYKDNYPRLQRVKQAYDPRDVFHHRLSVRLPG